MARSPQKHLKKNVVFSLKEIARQAGLSLSTIDRVVHGRDGVRPATRKRVELALRELKRQDEQTLISGRQFIVDLVMEAPKRFSSLVQNALETCMPEFRPAVFRVRAHLHEQIATADLVRILDRIATRGSSGIMLKAPDKPEIAAAIARLTARNIPVITFATDVSHSGRFAYIGIDNRAAGETAAYLIGSWLGRRKGQVLATMSSSSFRGEEEREAGFRRAMRQRYSDIGIVDVSGGFGRARRTRELVSLALDENPQINAVYSIGGANEAILEAFEQRGRACAVFVGHDLDADNTRLLKAGKINAILHNDVGDDMRRACRCILQATGALPATGAERLSHILVITPYNAP